LNYGHAIGARYLRTAFAGVSARGCSRPLISLATSTYSGRGLDPERDDVFHRPPHWRIAAQHAGDC
jgi:hypothetical protein